MPSRPRLRTVAYRYRYSLVVGLVALVIFYLIFPLAASYLLTRSLSYYGYEQVMVQLGYPSFGGIYVPVVSLQQDLGGEKLLISLTNAEIDYSLPGLFQGRVDRIYLPDVAVQVLSMPSRGDDEVADVVPADDDKSPMKLLTAGDLLNRLPIMPFNELQLERVTIFREEATGPLRRVTVSGFLRYRDGEVGGQLSFQGRDTATYGLTISGNSASSWIATLVSKRLQPIPIVSWRSEAHPSGQEVQVNGQIEVNVREFAPFIALLIPIGPELEKVTGHVTVHWVGTAATDAVLASLWLDSRTRLEGRVQGEITLPSLKGIAYDVTIGCHAEFTGTPMQLEWTLAPGVLLVATLQSRAYLLPEALRKLLLYGDQPVHIENAQPVQGTLRWLESPVRMTLEGPVHVVYGRSSGPFMAELETKFVEWTETELLSAAGTYHVAGIFPKPVAELLSAQEASGEFRGTLELRGSQVQGVLLPSSSVMVRQIERGAVLIPNVTLQVSDQIGVTCDLTTLRCSAGPGTSVIRLPLLHMMGRTIRVSQSTLALQLAESAANSWHMQGKLSLHGVLLDQVRWGIQPTDWKIRFLANQAGLKADLRIDAPFQDNLATAEIDQALAAGDGVLHGSIGPIAFDDGAHRLSKLVTGLSLPIEIDEGKFSSTIDMSWKREAEDSAQQFQLVSGTIKVVADKLSGRYDEFTIKEASTSMEIHASGDSSIAIVEPALVTVAAVKTGIDVTKISTMVQGTWPLRELLPSIELKDFRCEAFGGTISSQGLAVDPSTPPYHATISLQNLDLAKILSVEQNQGVQGTGILNGTLPVTISPTGVAIKEGTIIAMPPGGVIRYGSSADSSKVISESNTQLRLITQALNNFHYTLLRVGVDYTESGMLFLTVRLEGRNPDFKNVPPINFNVTVQEHVPTLLKSLRLVEGLEKTMEGKFKRP